MSTDQGIVFALIDALFVFLIRGRYRQDLVAFSALLNAYLLGLIPIGEVFSGFGHTAVITIALVLEILAVATAIPMILLVWPLRASALRSAPTLFCTAPAA